MRLAHRRRSVAVVAAAALLAVVGALRVALPIEGDVVRFLPAAEPEVQAFATLVERLHVRDVILVGVEAEGDDLFTAPRLRYLRALADALDARVEVAQVTGLPTLSIVEGGTTEPEGD